MHVTLEHTEEGAKRKHYFLSASVTFTETEKHIIQSRQLEQLPVISGAPAPPPGFAKQMSPALGGFGPLMILGGFVFGLLGGGVLAGLIVIVGIGLWIWSYVGDTVIEAQHGSKTYTVGNLLRDAKIRLMATDPVGTKAYENELRENLQSIKKYIEAAETLGAKESFEV
jgi:hypothetical protein